MLYRQGAVVLAAILGLGLCLGGCDRSPAQPNPPPGKTAQPGGVLKIRNAALPAAVANPAVADTPAAAGPPSMAVRRPSAATPADAIVLGVSDAKKVVAPFVVQKSESSPTGMELFLARTSPQLSRRASAMFNVTVAEPGKYQAWLHARWKDGCGNSVDVQVDALAARTFGQDAIYGVWHWVRAGEYDLSAGDHALFLTERENNIAIDQALLTRDAAFMPLGVLGYPDAPPERKIFADDFSRSPGHGLAGWEQVSGKWDISFTLDPNRIPNQYALTGTAERGEGVLLAKDAVWDGCRMRFALFPVTEGAFGAVLDRGAKGVGGLSVGVQLKEGRGALRVAGPGISAEKDLGDFVRLNQWHGITIERWERSLRVLLDEREVLSENSLPAGSGAAGLFVQNGSAIFDNVDIAQIPWPAADDREVCDYYHIGPYFFAQKEIEDAGDYYDFTPKELEEIARDPNTLRRQPKRIAILENSDNMYSPWQCPESAWNWRIDSGALAGTGAGATVHYAREFIGDMEMRFKCRLRNPGSAAEVELHAGPERGRRILLASDGAATAAGQQLCLQTGPAGGWHDVRIKVEGGTLSARLDDAPWQSAAITHCDGGMIRLRILNGAADFDAIEFTLPRRTAQSALYAMDRPETSWWREGGQWVDHGGVSCLFDSSWLSLVAPQSEGMIWNKLSVGGDLHVAFDVEEYTEWQGWRPRDTDGHIHHPYYNIRLCLSPDGKVDTGYRVEINSRNYTTTALYRNGKEVASVRQGPDFPVHFIGREFHSPQRPRRSRVTLVKRDGDLRLIINGRQVLRYKDAAPLPCGIVGIGGYKTHANFANVQIIDLAPGAAGVAKGGG